jgi:hypothetical protein
MTRSYHSILSEKEREREKGEEGRGERRDYCNKWEERERAGGLLKEHIIAYTHAHKTLKYL